MAKFERCERFVSCDWGTSHLRTRLVEREPLRIAAEVSSTDGAAALQERALADVEAEGGELHQQRARIYAKTLAQQVRNLAEDYGNEITRLPVVVSGMATSTIGWHDVPYATTPFRLDGCGLETLELTASSEVSNPVLLVSGVASSRDVLRGEETEALGILADEVYQDLQQDATLILPGTHAKHLRLVDRACIGFRTYMTGELFSLLAEHSVLRHTINAAALVSAWQQSSQLVEAFQLGVQRGAAEPLTHILFSVRAECVLGERDLDGSAAYLSGLIIGHEVADLARRGVEPLVFAPPPRLRDSYALACAALALENRARFVSEEVMRLAAARGQLLILDAATA